MLRRHALPNDTGWARPLQYPMLDLEFAQLSDVGPTREHNEDYVGHALPASPAEVQNRGWLFVLADGVGGHSKGEVASRTAVDSVIAGFRAATSGEPLSSLLPRLVQSANARVLEAGMAAGAAGSNMATTLVSCGLRFDRAVVSHVGDSRCYLIRRGQAQVLTRDHTVASDQVRLGLISASDAAQSPNRHMLSRSLGAQMVVNVETNEHQVLVGDVLVLCSDGLHGALSSAELADIVSHHQDLNAAARKLVALANQQDGGDNVSVQLVRVLSVERVGMYRGRPYRLR